jgi:predicted enzyme related to lactoylglutathione lyase
VSGLTAAGSQLDGDSGEHSTFIVNVPQADLLELAYTAAMPNNYVGRFAINADNVSRAREFYQKVFDWEFEPWGPPDFYLINTGDAPVGGSGGLLQERRELVPGSRMIGFECTIVVGNLDQTIRAIEANGGKMITEKFLIPTVCTVAYFQDTEGNVAGVSELEKA